MSRKCLEKELYENSDNAHQHNVYDDAAFLSFDEPADLIDFLKLGQWILQAQDGVISDSDFYKLQNCLMTDSRAMEFYVDFTEICAGLHTLYHEKQAVLT